RRLVVDAARTACLPLEVLHRARDVRAAPVDARLLERLVEDAPGGADERRPRLILLISGLLADEHDVRRSPARTEHDLRGIDVQGTSVTAPSGGTQRVEVALLGQERRGGREALARHRRSPSRSGQALHPAGVTARGWGRGGP